MSGESPSRPRGGAGGALAILPVTGLPEVRAGADLAALITAHAELCDGDVVVVSQKVVSKAEGALRWPAPGEDRTAARRRLAREQAVRVVVDAPHVLIVETRHGLVCANAGIDASNVPDGALVLLPDDPDASARRLRDGLRDAGVDVAVIVADTFGRPWRMGQTDVAIGIAGLRALRDERGGVDRHGVPLEVTEVAVADELAAAADLARRKADGVPVVVVRGYPYEPADTGEETGARLLQRPRANDLFARGRGAIADALGVHHTPAGAPDSAAPRDLARAAAAAERVGGASVRAAREGGRIMVTGPPVAAGLAAGAALAALVDLGYDAEHRLVDAADVPDDGLVGAGERATVEVVARVAAGLAGDADR